VDQGWLYTSATSIAAAIREGKASAVDVLEVHIQAIQRLNPTLNAVVADRFDLAREEARQADEAIRRGDPLAERPLHGVPCTIKESFAVRGMPNTSGLVTRIGQLAQQDAITVQRLKEAGAIIMGVTNVSELCLWMESNNRVYGRSRNPYDPSRTVGGSSGGEGCIVGSGASPFGLGADIGGSIRMPAFFGGVFGHKPSPMLVPNQGQFPCTETPAGHRMLSTGPICRRAEDLYPLLKVLSGEYEGQGGSLPEARPEDVDIGALKVVLVEDDGGRVAVDKEIKGGVRRVAEHLAARGAQVETRSFPELRVALEIWAVRMHLASKTTFTEQLSNGQSFSARRELLKAAMRRSDFTLPAIALSIIERLPAFSPDKMAAIIERQNLLRAEILHSLGPNGVMLYPPYPCVAPKHARPLLRPYRPVYTAALNALEFGVTQAPLGLNAKGLPLGVQIAAGPGADHRTIAVALEIERAFGGWQPPATLLA